MISGQDVRAYVSRVVQVATEGGRLAVVDVGVTHEGKIDSPGYSCVPGPLAESARATVEEMEAAYARASRGPSCWGWTQGSATMGTAGKVGSDLGQRRNHSHSCSQLCRTGR